MSTPSNPIMGADPTQSVPAVPVLANPPSAPDAPPIDTSTLGNTVPAMPIFSAPAPSTPIPSTPAAPATPPPAQGTPSVWKNLVMGAIYGLAGSQGATHFGGGAAGGAAGYVAGKQKEIENARAQQQLEAQKQQFQFASIKAADEHIKAQNDANAAHLAAIKDQQAIDDHDMQSKAFAKFYGIVPTPISGNSSAELHQNATGVMQDSAAPNGGQIPRVATTNSPDGGEKDASHDINAYYAPSPFQLQSNPNGTLGIVNDYRAVRGLPPYSPQDWRSAAGSQMPSSPADMPKVMPAIAKWQADQVADAQSGLLGIPQLAGVKDPKLDPKSAAAADANQLATLQAQLERVKNSSLDDETKGRITAQLQSQINGFQATINSASKIAPHVYAQTENTITKLTAPTAANAAGQKTTAETLAKEGTPGGQTELATKQIDLSNAQQAPVYAFNKKTGQLEQTTQAATVGNSNLTNPVKVSVADITKDQDMTRQLGDAQMNLSRYRIAANKMQPLSASDKVSVAHLLEPGALNIGVGEFEVNLPFSKVLDKLSESGDFIALRRDNPTAADAVAGYIGARGSVIAYQKAVSGSARGNEEQLKLELQNIPDPLLDAKTRDIQFDRFQQNIDQAGAGLPKMLGIDTPGEIRKKIEGADQAQPTKAKKGSSTVPWGMMHVYEPETKSMVPLADWLKKQPQP